MSMESFVELGKASANASASIDEMAEVFDEISKVPCFTTPLWKEVPRIMISINPKWCELIANGKKTIEVRRTKPKIETPFKCYIYCTKQKVPGEILLTYNKKVEGRNKGFRDNGDIPLAGKVIGEFICDEITKSIPKYKDYEVGYWDILDGSCLTLDEFFNYGKWNILYGWHISDLVIYDKPKELSEFFMPCREYFEKDIPCCGDCEYYKERYEYPAECACEGMKPLKRPFQSWGYAENYTEDT